MFAILLLLYALGKSFHLSSLLIILFFGLVLNNTQTFFRGPLKNMAKPKKMKEYTISIFTENEFILNTLFKTLFYFI